MQAFDGLSIKKPGATRQGFFFVVEAREISNIDLIRDIDGIIKLEATLFQMD